MRKSLTVRLLCVAFGLICTLVFGGTGEEIGNLRQAKLESDRESALDTVAYINQLNYAYQVMKTYHNVLAVQEEYERLSIDRIDVTRIPAFSYKEKAMVDLIRSMSNALRELRMLEDERRYYQEKMEDRRRRARKEMWINICTTVPMALNDAKDVIVKDAGKGDAYTVSTQALMAFAGDIVGGPVKEALSYDKTLDELRSQNKKMDFEYNKKKVKEVDVAAQTLLEAEWEFQRDKKLKREDIVTPDELRSLVDVLKNGNPSLVFKQLNTDDMRRHYPRFTPYWYYLASLAIQCKDYQVALEAADVFFAEYRGLLKVDPMVAQTAIACITALIATESKDYDRIRSLLKKICDVNYNNINPDYSYFCADVYYRYLNDAMAALKILEASNAKIEGDFCAKLIQYRNKYSEGEINMEEQSLPKDIDLIRIRTLYNDILADKRPTNLIGNIQEICSNQTVSALEKLFYVGRVRVKDLWNEAKSDVLSIKMRHVRPIFGRAKFEAEIPVSWFLLGEVEAKVMLYSGNKQVLVIDEKTNGRKIRKNDLGIGSDIVTLVFTCPRSKLEGIDSVRLMFAHKTWPVGIVYKPPFQFDIQIGNSLHGQKTIEYIAEEVSFMGEVKTLINPMKNIEERILEDNKLEGYAQDLWPFNLLDHVSYQTNYFVSTLIDSNRNFVVAYTNSMQDRVRMDLVVSYYNEYGARICHIESQQEIHGCTGGTWSLAWPHVLSELSDPAYVLLQYRSQESLWDKGKNYLSKWRQRRSNPDVQENKCDEDGKGDRPKN